MDKSRESPKPYMVTLENTEYKIKLLCNTNIMENDTLYVTDHDMNIDKLEYEKFHNSYCKNILGISKKSSNANVLGELGRFPLSHLLWSNNLKYWMCMAQGSENLLLNSIFQHAIKTNRWGQNIKYLLFKNGLGMEGDPGQKFLLPV